MQKSHKKRDNKQDLWTLIICSSQNLSFTRSPHKLTFFSLILQFKIISNSSLRVNRLSKENKWRKLQSKSKSLSNSSLSQCNNWLKSLLLWDQEAQWMREAPVLPQAILFMFKNREMKTFSVLFLHYSKNSVRASWSLSKEILKRNCKLDNSNIEYYIPN